MATIDDVVTFVRTRIRDTKQLFSAERDGDGRATVFDMPYVMIEKDDLKVTVQETIPRTLVIGTDYTLDDRHGTVQMLTLTPDVGQNVFFEGTHYTWFVNEDLQEFARTVVGHFTINAQYVLADITVDTPRFEVVGIGTIIEAFWSLLAETALDVDLRNPEGIDLPISQRFAQIQAILEFWQQRYTDLAGALNIGLDAIEMFTLRRISMATGRLVPVYVAQEIDDQTDPVRINPPIPGGLTA